MVKPGTYLNNVKELKIYTNNGVYSFDTKGLANIQNYGAFHKDRIMKIINNVKNKIGVLAFLNEEGKVQKIDLTQQTLAPRIEYLED